MARLGYDRYGAEGGDWGAMISAALARIDDDHVVGLHSNMLLSFPADASGITLDEQDVADLTAVGEFMKRGAAYQEIQGKNPQTLSYGLSDSPAGRGWIIEKFHAWTDHDGNLEDAVTRDQLLTNLTVYWATGTINSSTRLYCESQRSGNFGPVGEFRQGADGRGGVPRRDLPHPTWVRRDRLQPAALHPLRPGWSLRRVEEPDLLIADIREFCTPAPTLRSESIMHDLVIRGGNGTDAAARTADVAISNGVVTEVGRVEGKGREEIDADGLLVTPGFVDVHTHFDGQVTWDPLLTPTCWHGVTTVVMGNCGVGFGPCRDEHDFLIGLMEGVEDIPGAALSAGIVWEWETFPEYLDALDRKPLLFDVATQVPHGAVRTYVMGERGGQ